MRKDRRIFTRVFLYTMLLLVLMTGGTAILFARQFTSFYRKQQLQQLTEVFQPVISMLEEKKPEEIAAVAKEFFRRNQSFFFVIESSDGKILFSAAETYKNVESSSFADEIATDGGGAASSGSPDASQTNRPPMAELPPALEPRVLPPIRQGLRQQIRATIHIAPGGAAAPYILRVAAPVSPQSNYHELIYKSVTMLALMLALGIAGAVLFAKKVTKPLEDEVARERQMEENQRNFFSAASHELKTPIAAASALIEGMIANVGDYKDHPTYLRECLKTLHAQNKLVSEILEIVKLSDDAVAPVFEAVNCKELTASLLAEYQALAEWNGQTLTSDVPDVTVYADKHLLRRALSNVLSNAVQNTPENGFIRIFGALRESVKTDAKRNTFRLSVLNAHARIDADMRLFDPFYRGDQTGNRRTGRSGLGLTIVKKALDRMNIPFSLQNTAEGVLFYLDLEKTSDKIQTHYRMTTD
ncbi:MAG: HAMP domain-containing histidine kinase [Treponema sp.]|jgi:two-component system sensor histidine kinase VanS|nr:HAMP domain-containing histidine kinase [Treponema sp.]